VFVAVHQLDIIEIIFGFLPPMEIMQKRGVCVVWKEAARSTIVPLTDFHVYNLKRYNAMNVMTRALPNLQQITLVHLDHRHKYSDGEDPDRRVSAINASLIPHDIEIISNFSKLRILEIDCSAPLNGRYPFLFNSFPLLEKLWIRRSDLKWDLDMLAGLPLLKELYCSQIFENLTGNISSLRALKDTLERVTIEECYNVEGNFMDLADFPHLKELNLDYTAVTGDIRDIGEDDFSSLEQLYLPKGVYGGLRYKLQRITDGPDVVRAVYLLKKQRPTLKMEFMSWTLSRDSPDWYDPVVNEDDIYIPPPPPFRISLVQAGSRVGYRWGANYGCPCKVNWLDPEPDSESESSDYAKYTETLRQIVDEVKFYRGFHQPPTEEEYHRLVEDYESDSEESYESSGYL
jgi:hypothetical protein